MTRLRSAAQRAPQTLEQATVLLARYAEASAQAAAIAARRLKAIARIDAATDMRLVPLAAELKDLAGQLKPWWAASVDALTGGKRKSIELGGCVIGYRMTPPKVTFAHGKDQDAVDALADTGWDDELLRTRVTLDKPSVLKRLQGELHETLVPLELLGFEETQGEEFFVDLASNRPALT